MNYQQLNNGCVVAGRCGRGGSTGVEWEDPRPYELFVQKDAKGRNCLIALRGRDDFAEFDPRHDEEGTMLVSEDYYFKATAVIANPQ